MARPTTTLLTINGQAGDWDQTVDDNNDTLRTLLFTEPMAMTHVHRSTASESSTLLLGGGGLAAASYAWCVAILVDPATVATNGVLIYSDGTNWRYQKTNTIVT